LILDLVSAFGGKIFDSGLPEIRWVLAPFYSRFELILYGMQTAKEFLMTILESHSPLWLFVISHSVTFLASFHRQKF